jgi:hypothetical protein
VTLTHLLEGALLGALLACFRLSLAWKSAVRALQQFKEEQAARVAAALSNSTLVDGVELPKPDDERWKLEERTMTSTLRGDFKDHLLALGTVHVDPTMFIYVGVGAHMPSTKDTQKYCDAVWKAYRSRVARKAIEST